MIAGSFRVPRTPRLAIALQKRLAGQVVRRGRVKPRVVAGVDMSVREDFMRAALVVTRNLEPVETVVCEGRVRFPYIPGLLSFREIPALLRCWRKAKTAPDVIIVDGQGIAHPRRLGIASHLGLVLDRPTIGCAKSLLIGEYDEPGIERGSWSPLVDRGETIGAALRTQTGRNVVYVSIGHKVTLAEAMRVVLECAPRYRLPDPQRLADQVSKQRNGIH